MATAMEKNPLYFDHAATSYPKPEEVYQACDRALRAGGNPGRGGHRLALDAARLVFESREKTAAFFGVPAEDFVFTSGCTAAINLVLSGLIGAGRLGAGSTVLCSSYEHNAVMRPLHWLTKHNHINVQKIAPAALHNGLVNFADFERLLVERAPALCVLTLASNVTGEKLNLAGVNDLCLRYGVPLLVDGAQGAGAFPINLAKFPAISFFASSAHKSMLGPPGLGLLYVRQGQVLDPSLCGGTGSRSQSLEMPQFLPDRLEPGTPGVHLMAGLAAAVEYLEKRGAAIAEQEERLSNYFLERLNQIDRIQLHGRAGEKSAFANYLPTFALSFANIGADRIADMLDRQYDIAVRPGLHCAAAAHQTLGTSASGLVRISFGASTTRGQVEKLLQALACLGGEL